MEVRTFTPTPWGLFLGRCRDACHDSTGGILSSLRQWLATLERRRGLGPTDMERRGKYPQLLGGNPEVFLEFSPRNPWGNSIQFDEQAFFFSDGLGTQPSTGQPCFLYNFGSTPQTPGCGCLVTTRMTFFTVFRESGSQSLPFGDESASWGLWELTYNIHPSNQ